GRNSSFVQQYREAGGRTWVTAAADRWPGRTTFHFPALYQRTAEGDRPKRTELPFGRLLYQPGLCDRRQYVGTGDRKSDHWSSGRRSHISRNVAHGKHISLA